VDVSLHALLHLRAFFPDRSRYSLHWAPLGLTDFPDDNFPSILLSAVIGVVTDSVAKIILDECHRLLRAGGTLIMALVPSRGPYEYLLGRGSLEENRNAPGTFFRKYTLAEIEAKLARRNLKVIHTSRHIVKLPPFLRASTNQFYRYKWVQWLDALINNLPGLSTWYIVVASK
jgi:SAM-dependent methyltransferase